jgi:hypothetical protein
MALPARTDALDVIVELLTELDQEPGSGPGFYDRLCAALCRVTDMERASLLLYDEARQLVVPVGSHGIEPGILRSASPRSRGTTDDHQDRAESWQPDDHRSGHDRSRCPGP